MKQDISCYWSNKRIIREMEGRATLTKKELAEVKMKILEAIADKLKEAAGGKPYEMKLFEDQRSRFLYAKQTSKAFVALLPIVYKEEGNQKTRVFLAIIDVTSSDKQLKMYEVKDNDKEDGVIERIPQHIAFDPTESLIILYGQESIFCNTFDLNFILRWQPPPTLIRS